MDYLWVQYWKILTNPMESAYAVLLENGLDGAGEALRILVNEAARIERNHLEQHGNGRGVWYGLKLLVFSPARASAGLT